LTKRGRARTKFVQKRGDNEGEGGHPGLRREKNETRDVWRDVSETKVRKTMRGYRCKVARRVKRAGAAWVVYDEIHQKRSVEQETAGPG